MSRILEETAEVAMLAPQERVDQRTTQQVVDVPLMIQRQVPTIQKVQKTVELSQVQDTERIAVVPSC